MKPKKQSSLLDQYHHKFPPTPLFRGDIEEIINIGESRGLKVEISDSTAEFESLDDVKENRGNRVKDLDIKFFEEDSYKSINLKIGENGVELTASRADELAAAWHDIKTAIERRVPLHAAIMRPVVWMVILGIVVYVMSQLSRFINKGVAIAILLALAWMTLLSYIYVFRNSGVYLQKKHEVPGFWGKYGSDIFKVVGGAIVGAVAKSLLDHLAGKGG